MRIGLLGRSSSPRVSPSPSKSLPRSNSLRQRSKRGFLRSSRRSKSANTDISTPADFQHVTHVTSDDKQWIGSTAPSKQCMSASQLEVAQLKEARNLLSQPMASLLLARGQSSSSSVDCQDDLDDDEALV